MQPNGMPVFSRAASWWVLLAAAFVALQVGVLYLYGQPATCACGVIKLWESDVLSPGTSQQFFDWYTFSHIIHGFLFYAGLRYFFPKIAWQYRLAFAIGIEGLWEIVENSPAVIEHYRQQALAAGYVGDSILNSAMDTISMAAGFLFAKRFPIMVTIALALIFEIFTAIMIRDNLTLNVINLIHVVPSINAWQAGLSSS